jgi:hypothetical protein
MPVVDVFPSRLRSAMGTLYSGGDLDAVFHTRHARGRLEGRVASLATELQQVGCGVCPVGNGAGCTARAVAISGWVGKMMAGR